MEQWGQFRKLKMPACAISKENGDRDAGQRTYSRGTLPVERQFGMLDMLCSVMSRLCSAANGAFGVMNWLCSTTGGRRGRVAGRNPGKINGQRKTSAPR
jgi:hypothetical protein